MYYENMTFIFVVYETFMEKSNYYSNPSVVVGIVIVILSHVKHCFTLMIFITLQCLIAISFFYIVA